MNWITKYKCFACATKISGNMCCFATLVGFVLQGKKSAQTSFSLLFVTRSSFWQTNTPHHTTKGYSEQHSCFSTDAKLLQWKNFNLTATWYALQAGDALQHQRVRHFCLSKSLGLSPSPTQGATAAPREAPTPEPTVGKRLGRDRIFSHLILNQQPPNHTTGPMETNGLKLRYFSNLGTQHSTHKRPLWQCSCFHRVNRIWRTIEILFSFYSVFDRPIDRWVISRFHHQSHHTPKNHFSRINPFLSEVFLDATQQHKGRCQRQGMPIQNALWMEH